MPANISEVYVAVDLLNGKVSAINTDGDRLMRFIKALAVGTAREPTDWLVVTIAVGQQSIPYEDGGVSQDSFVYIPPRD